MSATVTTPAAETPQRTPPGRSAMSMTSLAPVAVPLVLVLLWQVGTTFIGEVALPTPRQTWLAFIDGVTRGWLTDGLWVTLEVVFVAFGVASIVALLVGFGLGTSKFWGDVLGAPLLWTYSLPKITIFPVFLLVFGLGDTSRTAFGAFHGFFPMAILVMNAVGAVPAVYLRSARSMNLSRVDTMIRVILPATLPSVFAGLRFCFSLSFIGVILAEMFGAAEGAGYELVRRISLQQLPEIFALALSLMAVALTVNVVMLATERKLLSPRDDEAGSR